MPEFWLVLILALVFDFLNGFHDCANLVATVIASRALPPRAALLLAAAAEFAGPFLFGTAVAAAIGKGLLTPDSVTLPAIACALAVAIVWNLATWFLGLPSSSSHALVGGMVGAATASAGWAAIQPAGFLWILFSLLVSPVAGLAAGWIIMRGLLFLCRNASPDVSAWFRTGQIVTSLTLAISHSTNDSQKTMGIITLALVASGMQAEFIVPLWVILISAGSLALGSAFGGWRLIRTLGGKIMKVRPIHGFASQFAGTIVILGAALAGGPVSSTQVLGSSLMGAGSAERITKVHWQTGQEMLWAWLLTIPACMAAGAGLFFLWTLLFA